MGEVSFKHRVAEHIAVDERAQRGRSNTTASRIPVRFMEVADRKRRPSPIVPLAPYRHGAPSTLARSLGVLFLIVAKHADLPAVFLKVDVVAGNTVDAPVRCAPFLCQVASYSRVPVKVSRENLTRDLQGKARNYRNG